MTTETLVRVLPWTPGEPLQLQWQSAPDVQPSQGEIEALAGVVAKQALTLLLPGEQVLALQVDVPGASPRQRRQAAPYAAEEQLTQPIESLHITVAAATREGPVSLLAIDREWLRVLLSVFEQHGLSVQAAVADWQALPEGESVLLASDQRVLVHKAAWQGFSAEQELAAMLLDGDLPGATRVIEYFKIVRQGLTARLNEANQLHGDFAPASAAGGARRWGWVGAAAAVLVCMHIGLTLADLWRLQAVSDRIVAQQAEVLREAFPELTRVSADPAGQMQAMLGQLRSERGQFAGGEWFVLMEPLAKALANDSDTRLQRVQYRSGSMEVEVNMASIPQLDELRLRLSQALPASQVEIASATRSEGRVEGRLLITQGAG
jgi:general secretion pathway protein L